MEKILLRALRPNGSTVRDPTLVGAPMSPDTGWETRKKVAMVGVVVQYWRSILHYFATLFLMCKKFNHIVLFCKIADILRACLAMKIDLLQYFFKLSYLDKRVKDNNDIFRFKSISRDTNVLETNSSVLKIQLSHVLVTFSIIVYFFMFYFNTNCLFS